MKNCSSSDSIEIDENCAKWNEIQPLITLNPFLIPHVVQKILSYSEFTDLLSSRLVSKLWKECGRASFNQRRTLRFKNFKCLDAFMSLVDTFEPQLTRNVCLHGPDFQAWIILLKPFFLKFGGHIKSISVSHGLGDFTEDLVLQIAQHVENLEELSISGTTVVYSDRFIYTPELGGGGFHFQPVLPTVKRIKLKLPVTCFKRWSDVRTFFTDFFSIFPNVESIKFVGCQFPELFRYLPETIRFPKLHHVHCQLLNSSGLDIFMRRGFFIDHMVLEVEPLLGLNHLHNFLESFAHCLKHLELRFHYKGKYNYSHNATAFPSSLALKQLTSLKLFGYWGHLYFLKDFPQLQRVTVEKMNWAIAFPRGTEEVGEVRNILKFFDESGGYHELNY